VATYESQAALLEVNMLTFTAVNFLLHHTVDAGGEQLLILADTANPYRHMKILTNAPFAPFPQYCRVQIVNLRLKLHGFNTRYNNRHAYVKRAYRAGAGNPTIDWIYDVELVRMHMESGVILLEGVSQEHVRPAMDSSDFSDGSEGSETESV
jgi:hypothetical protein